MSVHHDFELWPHEVRHVQKLFMGKSARIDSRKNRIKRFKKSLRPLIPFGTKAFWFQKHVQKLFQALNLFTVLGTYNEGMRDWMRATGLNIRQTTLNA